MRKILIISYFFPPSNLTASERVSGWAKNLSKFGYYPIVITRNWDVQGPLEKDRLRRSGSKVEIVRNDGYEVHYLPYKPSLRDHCLNKDLYFLSKVLTFFELVVRNFFISVIPFHNLCAYTKKMLESNKELRHLLISANPYEQFHFGYKLKKRFSDLIWVAEYRDEWTTREAYNTTRGKNAIVKFLERKSEVKWLRNADLVITTCDYFAKRISEKIAKPVKVVEHGLNNDLLIAGPEAAIDDKVFKVVYGGTLYPDQPVERFIQTWNSFAKGKANVELLFLGADVNVEAKTRVRPDINVSVNLTPRISREDSDLIYFRAAILLLLPYQKMKGLPPSKLYHYLVFKRSILLYPSDNDIMEEVLSETGLGVIPENEFELLEILQKHYNRWKRNEVVNLKPKNLNKYTQQSQTKVLAKFINELDKRS